MSAFEEEQQLFESVDSGLLTTMAAYDDEERILDGLIRIIAADTPDFKEYQDHISAQHNTVIQRFADLVLEIHDMYDLNSAKQQIVQLWCTADHQRVSVLTEVTGGEEFERWEYEDLKDAVDDLYEEAEEDNSQLASCCQHLINAVSHFSASDLNQFAGIIQSQYEQMISEDAQRTILDIDLSELRAKVVTVSGYVLAATIGAYSLRHYFKK